MTSPDLAETVKRLIQTLRAESKPRWISKGFYTGPKAQSGINCEDGNAAADTLETILDALEAAMARQQRDQSHIETWERETNKLRVKIMGLESSLAEARKGARTKGTVEVCPMCKREWATMHPDDKARCPGVNPFGDAPSTPQRPRRRQRRRGE